MPQEGFEGKSYKEQPEGISERGRAFLEALARRKRARGEDLPPLYQRLLQGAAPGEARALEPEEALERASRRADAPEARLRQAKEAEAPAITFAPPDPWRLARDLIARAETAGRLDLTPREREVYHALLALGLHHHFRHTPRLPTNLSQVVAFVPNDALSAALRIPPASLYRVLASLTEKGLIQRRAWRTPATLRGRSGVYAAGVVYAVRMPDRERRPRLDLEDLRRPWRDLEADAAAGRTAWKALRESIEVPPKGGTCPLESLVVYSLPPGEAENPLAIDSLTALLRAKGQARRALVEALALSLAREFRDPGSVRFYAWVLWNALRAEIYGLREGALGVVRWAVGRVREALAQALLRPREAKVRRPGALLAHLLGEQGLLALFRQTPSWRVA